MFPTARKARSAHLEVLRLHHAQLCAGRCELPSRVKDLPLEVCLPLHWGLRAQRAWAEALGDLAAGRACAAGGGVCAWGPPAPLKVLCQHPNRGFQSAGTAKGRKKRFILFVLDSPARVKANCKQACDLSG